MNIVEIYFRQKLIAGHRHIDKGGYVTEIAHIPESHQCHEKWGPQRLGDWGTDGQKALCT